MRLRKVEWWEVPRPKAADISSIRKDIDWLKKRRPEFIGGVGATGTYHRIETGTYEMRYAKASFNPGINVIGVATGHPVTIWLPPDLEHNHLVAVKDELGLAFQQPISIRVAS